MKRIAIFASGSGSNAEKIIERFAINPNVEISLIVSNKADAYVLKRAQNYNIETRLVPSKKVLGSLEFAEYLQEKEIDLIVLAGFLLLIPSLLISYFPDRIINIHPALLPKYGGKGMYGMHVHTAVVKNRDKESGITIHYVNEKYDDGKHILQVTCAIEKDDDPKILSEKIQKLEHLHYPIAIEKVLAEL